MNKRVMIVSVLTATVLLGGGSVYGFATLNTKKANTEQVTEVKQSATAKPVTKVEEPTATVTTTPEQTTSAPVQQQVEPPAPAPTYRTFDQLILDYPGWSSTSLYTQCANDIKNAFPERFTLEKAETNLRLVATHYTTSCGASFNGGNWQDKNIKPIYLIDYDGTGDFWQKNGGL